MTKPDMSCARVQQYQSSDIGSAERHNERKNESYDNINVEISRIPFNVHYKDTGGLSYMDTLRKLEADGKISLRGLRQDATLFDEIIIDVNTMYFERNGGYEYAKRFYEEAYALGAAILMPQKLIEQCLFRFGCNNQILIYGDYTLRRQDRDVIYNMTSFLGVSFSALIIRLRQLRVIKDMPLLEYHEPLEVVFDVPSC